MQVSDLTIERVAAAIHEAWSERKWFAATAAEKEDARREARAAIAEYEAAKEDDATDPDEIRSREFDSYREARHG